MSEHHEMLLTAGAMFFGLAALWLWATAAQLHFSRKLEELKGYSEDDDCNGIRQQTPRAPSGM